MPNGFHGSKAEWAALEAPLLALDDRLQAFADRHGITFTKNGRNWPDRALMWGDSIRRGISIFLADEKSHTYSVCFSALEDRRDERYWKRTFPKEGVAIDVIDAELGQLLESGYALVESWDGDSLEFATRIPAR